MSRNKTRTDCLERFQQLIDVYNLGSQSIEAFFNELVRLAQTLNEEDQRAMREGLTEEDLAMFDLLTKPEPELTEKETAQVKKVCKTLLEKLKAEKLVLDWCNRQQAQAAVKQTVKLILDGLPRVYTLSLYEQKCDLAFRHVYDSCGWRGQCVRGKGLKGGAKNGKNTSMLGVLSAESENSGQCSQQMGPSLNTNFMDRIQQLNYEKDFRIAFLESKGDGFQRLFEKLMLKAHPNDFMACRPWGKDGDRKNDGYLRSERTLFQSYAPNELKKDEAIKKINEDFEGAKKHWKQYFDKWVFVHNAPDGRLGPHVIEILANLGLENPEIKITPFGYEELLTTFRQLSLQDLESWFGPSLTMEANVNLGHSDLLAVLDHISVTPVAAPSIVKDVSRGKIEANLLSEAVADFLKIGMRKSTLVKDFFDNYFNPVYGEQIASAFKNKYQALKDATPRLHPDRIFGELEVWAGGTENTTPRHKAAVLAVMAYLFDRCEIFEDAQTVNPV